MREITYQQFVALMQAISYEGMEQNMWTLIAASEGESSDQLVGGTSNIKLEKGQYLAVWEDEEEQWPRFSNVMALTLFNDQYAIINNGGLWHKIYLFKLYNI